MTAQHRLSGVGLPWWAIVALAALGAPRVVLHDLDIVGDGGFDVVSLVLTVVPVAIWVAVLVARRVDSPVLTGGMIGAVFGVMLAAIHQLMWNEVFEDDPPSLGGNLEGELTPGAEEAVMRIAMVPSSLAVGIGLGLLAGLAARLIIGRRDR